MRWCPSIVIRQRDRHRGLHTQPPFPLILVWVTLPLPLPLPAGGPDWSALGFGTLSLLARDQTCQGEHVTCSGQWDMKRVGQGCYAGVVGKGLLTLQKRFLEAGSPFPPLDSARSAWDALELLLGWGWHTEEPQECPRSQPGPQGFLHRACPTYRLQVLWGNKSLCCLCQLGVEHSVLCSQSVPAQTGNTPAPWQGGSTPTSRQARRARYLFLRLQLLVLQFLLRTSNLVAAVFEFILQSLKQYIINTSTLKISILEKKFYHLNWH